MNPLIIKSTPKTPDVHFENNSGVFEIKGMSCAEYALEFYKQIFDWLDNYIKEPHSKTIVNIQFKYFNTSSAKCILQMLERFVTLKNNGNEVELIWHYVKNDEQMLDDGENYSEILGIPFKMKEVNSTHLA